MRNGNIREFVDRLWDGEELIYIYNGKKYFSGKAAQRKGNQTLVSLKGLKDDVHVLTMELDPQIQLDRFLSR